MTDNNIQPETRDSNAESTESTQGSGNQFSKRALAIIVIVALALSVGLYLLLTSGGDEEAQTTAPSTTVAEGTPSPTPSQPVVISEADTSPSNDITNDTQLDPEAEDEAHGPNPYDENGTEYIMTEASQNAWRPIRAKFILGLIGDGNIAEAVQGTATEDVMKQLENQPPGAFKDSIPDELGIHDQFDEQVSAYLYTEAIRMESGKWLYVTIAAYNDQGQETFRVSAYKIVDAGDEADAHDHSEDEGE